MRETGKRPLPQRLAEHLSLPEDVAAGAALITMVGCCGVRVENHRGILKFTEQCLILKTRQKNLCISGNALAIRQFSEEILEVSGNIESVAFQGGR